MRTEPLRVHLSDVAVDLICDHQPTQNGLWAAWRGARDPLMPARQGHRIEGRRTASDRFEVRLDDDPQLEHVEPIDLLASLETVLYQCIREWHAERLLLHAACLRTPAGGALLLLGESGAGKSSLARAAVQHGCKYFTDELTVCDGAQVWGIPRTIQFEPLPIGAPAPPWLGAIDRESYPLRDAALQEASVPLYPLEDEARATEPAPIDGTCVIHVRRTDVTNLRPATPVQALSWVHAASHRVPRLDLGRLVVGVGRCMSLDWSDPDRDIATLMTHLGF